MSTSLLELQRPPPQAMRRTAWTIMMWAGLDYSLNNSGGNHSEDQLFLFVCTVPCCQTDSLMSHQFLTLRIDDEQSPLSNDTICFFLD